MGGVVAECVLATRPWSFTAALVPILVTAAVVNELAFNMKLLQAVAIGVFVQAGANLTNTYFDYSNGIDTKDNTGDHTLVEKKLKPETVAFMSWICYAVGISLASPVLMEMATYSVNPNSAMVFATGLILAYFYTAKPVGLKYKAMGDLTIFACFGPLLMQFTSLFLTGFMRNDLYLYSVPIGLYTEAILHANNARDIKADAKAGAVTLATLVGKEHSYTFYVMLFVAAYSAALAIAIWHHWAVLATLITLPLTAGLLGKYKSNNMQELPEETAKAHLPFGLTMLVGIIFSDKGLL